MATNKDATGSYALFALADMLLLPAVLALYLALTGATAIPDSNCDDQSPCHAP